MRNAESKAQSQAGVPVRLYPAQGQAHTKHLGGKPPGDTWEKDTETEGGLRDRRKGRDVVLQN